MRRSHEAHEASLQRGSAIVLPFEPSPARRRRAVVGRPGTRTPPRGVERRLLLAPPPRGSLWRPAEQLLGRGDVRLGGSRPWDIQVSSPHLYARFLAGGVAGLAGAYVDGWWESGRPDETLYRALTAAPRPSLPLRVAARLTDLLVERDRSPFLEDDDPRADFWHLPLDRRMAHGCALWDARRDLDGAQEARLETMCRRLDLRPGMRLLDLSCGWGATARFAAGLRGAQTLALTPWESQASAARGLCRGVPVEVRCQGWRDLLGERFDRAVAVAGLQPLPGWGSKSFFRTARRRLEDGGILLVHGLGSEPGRAGLELARVWPGELRGGVSSRRWPSLRRVCRGFSGSFVLQSWCDLSADYEKTLRVWADHVEQALPDVVARHGERYCRLWRIALLARAAACRAGGVRLWELVLAAR
jgi:cyclopropane-fatty-acyl-phospholipid synthase